MWYHSAFAWSFVSMAQWIRPVNSAAHHKETLLLRAASVYIQNVEIHHLEGVRMELLKVPNGNSTGRLPAVALLHVHMKVCVAVTILGPRKGPVWPSFVT